MKSGGFLLTLSFVLSCACTKKHISSEECRQMLTKYIDMTLGAEPSGQRERTLAARIEEPVYTARERQCEQEVTPGEFACAMRAGNADEWEACIQ